MTEKSNPPGRWFKQPHGYSAFIPNPLPPQFDWTPDLARSLSEADHVIGQLAREGSHLKNPHVLIRPFVQREAVYSSRIEGTQSTLGELLAVEAGAVVERSPHDLREVGNYVTALEYGIKRLKKLPLSLRLIRELHEKLMKGHHGAHATPGEFRRSQNWIGPAGCTLMNASYVPPPPDKLMECLGEWEKFMHDHALPPLVQIAMLHYQFEAIHPFLDGNGRVGRLLITLFLVERKILPTPLLYLSAFFEATRRDYYDYLKGVSSRGEWALWIQYFLNGVSRQAEDALARSEQINKTVAQWRKKILMASSKQMDKMFSLLAENPFITVTGTAEKLGVAFSTAQRTLDKLESLSVIKQMEKRKRNRVYCAEAILNILEAPARLKPDPH